MIFKRLSGWLFLVSLVILLLCYRQAGASSFNFAVEIEKPANQIDAKKGYFDLLISPGQTQQLKVKVTNTTNKAVTIRPKIASATTNNSGVVDYSPRKKKRDATMPYDVTKWLTVPREITIAADSTYLLPIEVAIPDEKFSGTLVAGLTLTEERLETKATTGDGGMAIDNRYAYVVGFELRQSTEKIRPQLELTKVFVSQRNYRNIVAATIQNKTSTFVNQLQVEGQVTRKGQTEVLYENSTTMMQMAPNTNFDYPISLDEGERLQAGDYTLKMTASSFKEKWQWQKNFTITSAKAKEYNDTDVTVRNSYVWFYSGGIIIVVFLFGLCLYLMKKRQQNRGGSNDEK